MLICLIGFAKAYESSIILSNDSSTVGQRRTDLSCFQQMRPHAGDKRVGIYKHVSRVRINFRVTTNKK